MMAEENRPKYREAQHRIADAIFDFSFAEACAEAGDADGLRVLIQEMLLPIVDEVFSEVSVQRDGYIEQLTIDLGIIDVANFQSDVADRLRLALKSALEDQLPLLGSERLASRKKHAQYPALSVLENFLTQGHFPANRLFEKGRTIDEILSEVLERSPEVFTVFLRKMKHQPQILKRLIYQSSEQRLAKLVSLLSPLDSEHLFALVKTLKQVLKGIPEMTLSAADLHHDIWQALLDFLLYEKQGNIDARHLMNHIKQKIVARNKGLEKQVSDVLRALGPQLHLSSDSLSVPRTRVDKGLALEALAQLKRNLLAAIQTGNAENLRGIWQGILRDHSGLLKSILLDEGRRIAVRRVLSRKFSDEMLRDIVRVIDPESSAFVHEIVTRPALFVQTKNKKTENLEESKSQLWEFTLSYLIIERGSHFNKQSYLGSLLAQMAAHENSTYSDLLHDFIHKLDEIEIVSGVRSEMRDLLFSLAAEDDAKKAVSPVSLSEIDRAKKQLALIQAYDDYERLYRAFFDKNAFGKTGSSLNEPVLMMALDTLRRLQPAILLRFFRTLQVEARGVQAYRHAFSAQMLLRLIKVFLVFRLQAGAEHDLMQSVEKYASDQKHLNHYYAQILFALIQNVPIDFEAILEVGATLPEADDPVSENQKATEKDKNLAAQKTQMDLLRTKVTEALLQGRPQGVQGFWPAFIQTEAPWLCQALLVYGQNTEVLKKLAQSFPDPMLLDLVGVLVPEAVEMVSNLLKQPRLFQKKTPGVFEKENKAVFWQYTLSTLIADRGSRFNKKSYLSRLIFQMASHRNTRSQEILQALTEGFEAIEISRVAKSEMLLILRALSQEGHFQKIRPENEVAGTPETFDVTSDFRDLKYFLTQGRWPKNDQGVYTEAIFLKMLNRLFQSDRVRFSRLFAELQSAERFRAGHVMDCSPGIFMRLIVIFLSLEHSKHFSAASEFMQAMISHALRAEHQSAYYQRVFSCLITKEVLDFEALCSGDRSTALQGQTLGPRKADAQQDAEGSLKSDFAYFEKISNSQTILSAQDLAKFLRSLETLLASAPKNFARLLKNGFEQGGVALRLSHLLPESLLARLLLLLNPGIFEAILRCADLIASAACVNEIALSPKRIARLKWQFIFQYLFEEGRRFQVKSFVSFLTEKLARDAYYSDVAAFRVLLRHQLESHHKLVMGDEVSQVMETLSQADPIPSSNRPVSKKSVSLETPAENSGASQPYFEEIEVKWDETIHLENAGLVIAAPYLERFFALLNLTEGRAFKDPKAARRAVHLLQFLVDESTDSPEYQLVLNKILCGVKPGIPMEREIMVTAHEIKMVEGLLQGMIANWTQIGKTSLQGFRASFLQREGVLRRQGDDWQLEVEAKGFDVLLDYIPWSFSIVRFPWMQGVIHVKWRSDEGA